SSVRSSAIMGCSSSPTATPTSSARTRNTSTRCASPHGSCGASRPLRRMPSTSICGTTILSRPDAGHELTALPSLPRDHGGPVFAEPWHAQAFALAVTLSGQGHFTWKEWAGELADTLRAAVDRGEPDDGSRYYDHWLATLERVVTAKGLTDQATL